MTGHEPTLGAHTLDDLVEATGFTKRQIRFYITKRLVPGAGGQRGPYTVYPHNTLQRLQLIKVLKQQKIAPTGRRLTLDEIRHHLDDSEADIAPKIMALQDIHVREMGPLFAEYSVESDQPEPLASFCQEIQFPTEGGDTPPEDDPLDLLCRLRDLLAELGSDTRFTEFLETRGPDRWQRVTTPDVEFHVRQPDDHMARRRLASMADALARLLEREE